MVRVAKGWKIMLENLKVNKYERKIKVKGIRT